jgi:hypothetical protein
MIHSLALASKVGGWYFGYPTETIECAHLTTVLSILSELQGMPRYGVGLSCPDFDNTAQDQSNPNSKVPFIAKDRRPKQGPLWISKCVHFLAFVAFFVGLLISAPNLFTFSSEL